MDRKKLSWLCIAAFIILAVWFRSWCQPATQVRRAQERLIEAVESRDFEAMDALLAHDYRDRWGHDKRIVLSRSREIFGQFALLTIEHHFHALTPAKDGWVIAEKIRIKGLGSPIALYARDEVNGLTAPFAMTWRKRGWKPWDWELTETAHPGLRIR